MNPNALTNSLEIDKIKSFIGYRMGGNAMDRIKRLNKQRLAKNVYRMIIESQYSIESVALSLDISERLIYYWQEGKRSPAIEHVYGLSQLFNVPMESILA